MSLRELFVCVLLVLALLGVLALLLENDALNLPSSFQLSSLGAGGKSNEWQDWGLTATSDVLISLSESADSGDSADHQAESHLQQGQVQPKKTPAAAATSVAEETLYPGWDPSRCDRVDQKEIRDGDIRVVFGNRVILQRELKLDTSFGNTLSRYWAARTLAELAGYYYMNGKGVHRFFTTEPHVPSFIYYLPMDANAKPRRPEPLHRFLCDCPKDLIYLHECAYGYWDIHQTIQQDTRKALRAYADHVYPAITTTDTVKSNSKTNTNKAPLAKKKKKQQKQKKQQRQQMLGQFVTSPHDWLIYERCVILEHQTHGFATLSAYKDVIPAQGTFTVFTLSGRNEGMGEVLCPEMHDRRDALLKRANPNLTIVHLPQSQDRSIDFGRLAFAPNLFLPSAGSSWALWAAMANTNKVVMVPFKPDHTYLVDEPDVAPPNVHLLTNATILYNPAGHAASAKCLNFTDGTFANTTEGRRRFFHCYQYN